MHSKKDFSFLRLALNLLRSLFHRYAAHVCFRRPSPVASTTPISRGVLRSAVLGAWCSSLAVALACYGKLTKNNFSMFYPPFRNRPENDSQSSKVHSRVGGTEDEYSVGVSAPRAPPT